MPAWSKPFAKAVAWNHTFKNIRYLVTYILFLKKTGVLENLLSLFGNILQDAQVPELGAHSHPDYHAFGFKYSLLCQPPGSTRTTTASPGWLRTPSAATRGAWIRRGSWTTASTPSPSGRRSWSSAGSRRAASNPTGWRRKSSLWAARVSPPWSSTRPEGSRRCKSNYGEFACMEMKEPDPASKKLNQAIKIK